MGLNVCPEEDLLTLREPHGDLTCPGSLRPRVSTIITINFEHVAGTNWALGRQKPERLPLPSPGKTVRYS